MDIFQILVFEHALIREYLQLLEGAIDQLRNGRRPPLEFFHKAARFGREFVGTYHHIKEEDHVFAFLAQKNAGLYEESIAHLRAEHDQGGEALVEISSSLLAYSRGDEDAALHIERSLAGYVAMLTHHVFEEDHVFFPAVQRELTEEERDYLFMVFQQEFDKAGQDAVEQYSEVLRQMGVLLRESAGAELVGRAG